MACDKGGGAALLLLLLMLLLLLLLLLWGIAWAIAGWGRPFQQEEASRRRVIKRRNKNIVHI